MIRILVEVGASSFARGERWFARRLALVSAAYWAAHWFIRRALHVAATALIGRIKRRLANREHCAALTALTGMTCRPTDAGAGIAGVAIAGVAIAGVAIAGVAIARIAIARGARHDLATTATAAAVTAATTGIDTLAFDA
jgi:hypothetical protein